MRLFTAVDIPDSIKDSLAKTIERLRPFADLKWTNVDKLHITTKFIGEWRQDRMPEMTAALRGVGSPGAMFIAVRGIEWIPDARHPRMLWAGVEAAPGLASLATETEEALRALGVAVEDRKYSPHLTLARIRDHAVATALRPAIEPERQIDFGSFTASAFCLYLSQDGRYTKLAEFSLV
jgi:RNA 2',3'-cyclic 3'-phosphodiesterase